MARADDDFSPQYRSFLERQRETTSPPSPQVSDLDLTALQIDRQEADMSEAPSAEAFPSSPLTLETTETEKKEATPTQETNEGGNLIGLHPVRSGLPMPVKRAIVQKLACFQTVDSIAKEIYAEFGLTVQNRVISSYDPSRPQCVVGRGLRRLFEEQRKAYVTEAINHGVAHQAHRLMLIGKLVEKATNSKDYAAALKGLELAAKEMGGVLEGKTTVTHQGTIGHVHGSVDDMRMELGMRLQGIVDGGHLLPAPAPTPVVVDAVPTETPETP